MGKEFLNGEYTASGFAEAVEGRANVSEYYGSRESWAEWSYQSPGFEVEIPGLGKVELVESEPGGEGMGESIFMVFKVTTDDGVERYFRKTGYYASYDGSDWDGGVEEVEGTKVQVTQWVRKR